MNWPIRSYIKIYLWAAAISLAAFFAYNFLQDVFGGETARVRKFITRGKVAIEKKNIIGLSDMISLNYKDKYGNDRQTLIYAVRSFLSYYKDTFINIESMDIKLNGPRTEADVEIIALIIGKTKEGGSDKILEGLEGEKDRFRVKLIKEDKRWRLLEVEFLEPINIMNRQIASSSLSAAKII